MNTLQIDIIVAAFGIALLCLFWRFVWVPFTIQRLRQDIFDVRDELFDKVALGDSSHTFESDVYRDVRADLNRIIRCADHMGFIRIIIVGILAVDSQKDFIDKINEERSDLSEEDLKLIRFVDRKQEVAIKRFLLLSSPTLWLILGVASIFAIFYTIYVFIHRRVLTYRYFYRTWVFRNILDNIEYQSGQLLLSGRA